MDGWRLRLGVESGRVGESEKVGDWDPLSGEEADLLIESRSSSTSVFGRDRLR